MNAKQSIWYKQTFLQIDISLVIYRCRCLKVFHKIGILESIAKLSGQQLCWSPFLNKVAGLQLLP